MHVILSMHTMPKSCSHQMEHIAKFKISKDLDGATSYYAITSECNATLAVRPKPSFMTHASVFIASCGGSEGAGRNEKR